MSFFENTRKPTGFGGKLMVSMMNFGHSSLANWGLSFLNLPKDAKILDCGCGGGANIKKMLKRCPEGIVKGIDYAQTHLIDPRFFKGSIEDYVKKNKIDEVLVLYNIPNFTSDTSFGKLCS